uniref:Immunoglobulin V-set domain-containing protein n=1 Tax=Equus asinus TaxID=9793 RepID=A0A9L0JC31_EQUAS
MLSLFQALPLAVLEAYKLFQPQLSSTKRLSKTATWNVWYLVTISTMSVYWYQESPGQVLQPLLHVSSDNTVRMESGVPMGKFKVDEIPEPSMSTLTTHNVGTEDLATYYCAFWEVHSGRC